MMMMNMDDNPSKNLRCGSSSNKIRQIVRLQQLLKKWKKIAAASPSSTHLRRNTPSTANGINKFLKKTLSFSDKDKDDNNNVPKGCLAVLCVGKEEEEKRFVIPMSYLAHHSFQVLLREAEEEFGFQQQGILKIPCQVSLFENILKIIQYDDEPPLPAASNKRQQQPDTCINDDNIIHNVGCCSPENHQQHIMPPQMCTT